MRGAKNRKIKAKRCGAPRGGQRAPINCGKLLSTFWKVKHYKGGGGGSMVGGPKNSNKKSSNAAESGATYFGHDRFWPTAFPCLATTLFGHDLVWPRPLATVSPTLATVNCGIFEGEEGVGEE